MQSLFKQEHPVGRWEICKTAVFTGAGAAIKPLPGMGENEIDVIGTILGWGECSTLLWCIVRKEMNRKSESFKYRPYHIYVCALPFLIIEDILFLIVSCVSLQTPNYGLFSVFFVFLMTSGILTKLFYDLGRVVVAFEEEHIHIFNDRRVVDSFILWENLQYGYYCCNYKMHLHLVLSKEVLEENKIKELVRKSTMYGKIRIDDVLVIKMPFGNKDKQLYIQKYISNKIPNIKEL